MHIARTFYCLEMSPPEAVAEQRKHALSPLHQASHLPPFDLPHRVSLLHLPRWFEFPCGCPIQLFCSLWEAGAPGLAMGMRGRNGFAGELCTVFVGGKEEGNTLVRVSVTALAQVK